MRTTIAIDDQLGRAAKERAAREGMSLSAFIARAVQQALAADQSEMSPPPFRLITVGGGGPVENVDLDRTSDLLEAEDLERYGSRR